jgi:hypothetical protein
MRYKASCKANNLNNTEDLRHCMRYMRHCKRNNDLCLRYIDHCMRYIRHCMLYNWENNIVNMSLKAKLGTLEKTYTVNYYRFPLNTYHFHPNPSILIHCLHPIHSKGRVLFVIPVKTGIVMRKKTKLH